MTTKPDLRVLFPTSFSDACFRTIRAIAQLGDSCDVDLTIAHVAAEGEQSYADTQHELQSFFAEADHYSSCRRVLLQGDPVQQISDLARSGRYDLVMIPASDRIGLPSFLRSSSRARLLERCPTPLWTIGKSLDNVQFRRRVKTVTCLMDFDYVDRNHLRLAASFASRLGATLRVVHVIEPVDEGTLARFCFSSPPLHPDVARAEIRALFRSTPNPPEVEIAVGTGKHELARLLNGCQSDVMFAGPGHTLRRMLFAPQLQSYLQKLPCPVICIDGAAKGFTKWSFEESGDEAGIATKVRASVQGAAV